MKKAIGLSIVCFVCLIMGLKCYADCIADASQSTSGCSAGCEGTAHRYTYAPSCGQCDSGGSCTPNVHSSVKTDQQVGCVPGAMGSCEPGTSGSATTSTIACGCSP
jgi:hypothetical protein